MWHARIDKFLSVFNAHCQTLEQTQRDEATIVLIFWRDCYLHSVWYVSVCVRQPVCLSVCMYLFVTATDTYSGCVNVCVVLCLFLLVPCRSTACVCLEAGEQVISSEIPLAFDCVCLSMTHPSANHCGINCD